MYWQIMPKAASRDMCIKPHLLARKKMAVPLSSLRFQYLRPDARVWVPVRRHAQRMMQTEFLTVPVADPRAEGATSNHMCAVVSKAELSRLLGDVCGGSAPTQQRSDGEIEKTEPLEMCVGELQEYADAMRMPVIVFVAAHWGDAGERAYEVHFYRPRN